ncbi:MAG: AraC family transcriptional regulator [Saprospiraceae bacterium]|nr:AraC family transcriptional regulator [Saprospiraceae bacterium]
MSFVILLFHFFAFLGVLLFVLFFLKQKGDSWANRLLGLYTLLFSVELLNNTLRWSGAIEQPIFVHINLTHFPLWLLYGPLVYLYVRRVVTGVRFRIYDLLFLIPPLVIIYLLFPFYRLNTMHKVEVVKSGRTFEFATFPPYAIWIVIFLMFGYAFLTYFSFHSDKKVGFRENVWLRYFTGSYFGFCLAFASYIFLVRFGLMDPSYDYFIDILIVIFIAMLAFFGFVQPDVFAGRSIREMVPFIKYRKTGLTSGLSLKMKERLVRIMEDQELFLNSELRLNDLADALDLSRNHTSQVINEHFNLSFFDFVNSYRIDYAKKLLLRRINDRSTVAQIAFEAGFNNRASFYKAFRKFTGISPSDFITRHRD